MKHLKNWILAALLGVNIAGNVSAQTSQQPITVNWGTFNIRYDNPDDQENNWKFRKDRVATFIQQEKLDIVGMQEVLHNQLEDLKTRLPEYAEVGIGREDGKQQGEYAPIFYRKDRFKLLDSNTFWLSQYPDSVLGRCMHPYRNLGQTGRKKYRKDFPGCEYPHGPCRR